MCLMFHLSTSASEILCLVPSFRGSLHDGDRRAGVKKWVTLCSSFAMTQNRTTHNSPSSLWPLDWKCTPAATLLLCLCSYLPKEEVTYWRWGALGRSGAASGEWTGASRSRLFHYAARFFVDADLPLLTSRDIQCVFSRWKTLIQVTNTEYLNIFK